MSVGTVPFFLEVRKHNTIITTVRTAAMRRTPSDNPTESPITELAFSAGGRSMVAEGEGEERISTVGDSVTVVCTKLQIHVMIYLKCVPNYVGGKRCLSSFSTHIVWARGWLRLQDIARVGSVFSIP